MTAIRRVAITITRERVVRVPSDEPAPGAAGELWYTQDEAAAKLKVSAQTLRRWERTGKPPPTIRDGKTIRYHRDDLDRLAIGESS